MQAAQRCGGAVGVLTAAATLNLEEAVRGEPARQPGFVSRSNKQLWLCYLLFRCFVFVHLFSRSLAFFLFHGIKMDFEDTLRTWN